MKKKGISAQDVYHLYTSWNQFAKDCEQMKHKYNCGRTVNFPEMVSENCVRIALIRSGRTYLLYYHSYYE